MGGVAIRALKELKKPAVVHLALYFPDCREHLLVFGLVAEIYSADVSAVALQQFNEERVLVNISHPLNYSFYRTPSSLPRSSLRHNTRSWRAH